MSVGSLHFYKHLVDKESSCLKPYQYLQPHLPPPTPNAVLIFSIFIFPQPSHHHPFASFLKCPTNYKHNTIFQAPITAHAHPPFVYQQLLDPHESTTNCTTPRITSSNSRRICVIRLHCFCSFCYCCCCTLMPSDFWLNAVLLRVCLSLKVLRAIESCSDGCMFNYI